MAIYCVKYLFDVSFYTLFSNEGCVNNIAEAKSLENLFIMESFLILSVQL